MQERMTTNEVRRFLKGMGAVNPGRKAVRMVASHQETVGNMDLWELMFPAEKIRQAVSACQGMKGEASYTTFNEHLYSNNST